LEITAKVLMCVFVCIYRLFRWTVQKKTRSILRPKAKWSYYECRQAREEGEDHCQSSFSITKQSQNALQLIILATPVFGMIGKAMREEAQRRMSLLQLGEQFAGAKTWSEKRRLWTDPILNTAEMNNSISCVSLSCKSDHDYRLNWNPSWANVPCRQIVMGRHERLCDSLSVICSLLSQLGASSQLVRSQLRLNYLNRF
jgi:hypothetical protein